MYLSLISRRISDQINANHVGLVTVTRQTRKLYMLAAAQNMQV